MSFDRVDRVYFNNRIAIRDVSVAGARVTGTAVDEAAAAEVEKACANAGVVSVGWLAGGSSHKGDVKAVDIVFDGPTISFDLPAVYRSI